MPASISFYPTCLYQFLSHMTLSVSIPHAFICFYPTWLYQFLSHMTLSASTSHLYQFLSHMPLSVSILHAFICFYPTCLYQFLIHLNWCSYLLTTLNIFSKKCFLFYLIFAFYNSHLSHFVNISLFLVFVRSKRVRELGCRHRWSRAAVVVFSRHKFRWRRSSPSSSPPSS